MALDAARVSLAFNHPQAAWAILPVLAACLAAGIAIGTVYFRSVWQTARLLDGSGNARRAVALTAGRFVLLGSALFLASLLGAAPLLAVAAGVLMARFAVMRRTARASEGPAIRNLGAAP